MDLECLLYLTTVVGIASLHAQAMGDYVSGSISEVGTFITDRAQEAGEMISTASDKVADWWNGIVNITSKTHWNGTIPVPGGQSAAGRLDSEPLGDGRRIHLQWKGIAKGLKYHWDNVSKQFVDNVTGKPAPNVVNKNDELKKEAEKHHQRLNP